MTGLMEKFQKIPFKYILAGGLLLISLLFVLMFRFAEMENLYLVILTSLLIGVISIIIIRIMVHKVKYDAL